MPKRENCVLINKCVFNSIIQNLVVIALINRNWSINLTKTIIKDNCYIKWKKKKRILRYNYDAR